MERCPLPVLTTFDLCLSCIMYVLCHKCKLYLGCLSTSFFCMMGRCEALVAQYCVQVADGLFEALNQTLCGGLDRIVTVM